MTWHLLQTHSQICTCMTQWRTQVACILLRKTCWLLMIEENVLFIIYSVTSTNGHLPTKATSPQLPLVFALVDNPYTHSYLSLSSTATSSQRQRGHLSTSQTIQITSLERPVKQRLATDELCLLDHGLCFIRSRDLIRTFCASMVSVWCLLYWYISIVLGMSLLQQAFYKCWNVFDDKNQWYFGHHQVNGKMKTMNLYLAYF